MSIFWIGGPKGIIVPFAEMNTTEEDRYFLPGVIHGGENYLIQVYAWNNDGKPEGERIGAKYLFAENIVEWAKEATLEDGVFNRDVFEECINEGAEEFVVENDGTGDFVSLNEKWSEALPLTYEEVIAWAEKQIEKAKMEANVFELKVDISNLRHELEGALLNGEDDVAPDIEKRLILRECLLFGALQGVKIDEVKLEAFVFSADFENQCEKFSSLDVLLEENGFLPPKFSRGNFLDSDSIDISGISSNPFFEKALKSLALYFNIDPENIAADLCKSQRFEDTLGFSFYEAINATSENYMLSDICHTYISNFDVARPEEENWKEAVRITVQGYQYHDHPPCPTAQGSPKGKMPLDQKIRFAEAHKAGSMDEKQTGREPSL